MLARADRRKAWDYFLQALESDIADAQGGTTGEGIHLGAMAGTVDLLERGFTGLETRGDVLGFDPYLPDALRRMRFRLRYRRHTEIDVALDHQTLGRRRRRISSTVLPVRVRDEEFRFDPRGSLEIPLRGRRD